jgi:hypothetical protein
MDNSCNCRPCQLRRLVKHLEPEVLRPHIANDDGPDYLDGLKTGYLVKLSEKRDHYPDD